MIRPCGESRLRPIRPTQNENATPRRRIFYVGAAWRAARLQTSQDPLETAMQLNLAIAPLVSLIAGILILAMPRLLNYIIALYLIIIGLVGLFGH
ncbi:hypothetical protein GCM10007860_22800 [Chitiniphilus shinanonensis]|uniref:DUF3096 domain-containing protein n=1 Tax=Chitiniphilus shinanonensis TaxID=553088 RepID=A0ABQ6BSZ9_9NEIS|nr:hypothetical protein GCM10007860_22800 [Chitiniphilus shinanonensis]